MRIWIAASTLLLLLINHVTAFAGDVSNSRARTVAQNWLNRSLQDKKLTDGASYAISVEEPIVVNGKTVGYNFQLAPVGHIIVPSRDELPVVKLYSFRHTLSMADDQAGVVQWIKEELALLNEALESHAAEMATVDQTRTKNGMLWALYDRDQASFAAKVAASSTVEAATGQVGPLLSTTWGQSDPYNLYTPRWYDGRPTVTGCVATAAAQIMKYWNYPESGQGSTSYTWYDGSTNRTLSANFSQSTYNWSAMTNSYGPGSTQVQREAVGKLMADVGIAFHMSYGKSDTNGSSASTVYAATVFPQYFGYKNTISTVSRSSYPSDSAWMQVFKSEVQSGRPAQLRIRDPQKGGHSIVVDGYRDTPTEQIHLNLGWDGIYDAWYVSNNINQGGNWTDVNYQAAVIGIEPPTTSTVPSVTTKSASSVAATGATLNGTVNPNGVTVSGFFQYGTTTSYGSSSQLQSLGSGRTALPVSAELTGLSCGSTVYHYRAVAQTADGTNQYGNDATFTTLPCTQAKATATTNPATNVGQSSATLNATVNPNGASTTTYFQYGATTSYGNVSGTSSSFTGTTNLSFDLSGLTCGGATYNYRIVATNSGGTSYGSNVSFTTAPCAQTPPTVTTAAASAIGRTGATLNGTANPNGASTNAYFQYGTTNSYGSATASQGIGSGSSALAVNAQITGLTCGGTTYHYRQVASNSGGPSYGNDMTFSTAPCPDVTPNQFSFTPQTNLAPGSMATSNVIIVSGIEAATAISVSGGIYSVNGGPYTTLAGTVNDGDQVTVRLTSSSTYATTNSAVLTIGGVSGTFSVTTIAAASSGVNLIGNPDYESGDTEWTSYSSGNYQIITNSMNWGNNGSNWFAFLGGEDSLNENIYQDVTIPANATVAQLSFFYDITTEETQPESYDTCTVAVVDPATGNTLTVLETLDNLDATTDWSESAKFDLLPYKGRTVRIKFSGQTDYDLPTAFFIDDVKLMYTGGEPDLVPPTVSSTQPGSGAVNVPLESGIRATFSEPVAVGTINSSTFILNPQVPGTVSYDATTRTATFTPSAGLAPNVTYTATIGTAVTDLAGNPMSAPQSWSFTTAAASSLSNLLQNGSFEQGRVAWSETNSANNYNINQNAGLGHNNSDWYIYTGVDDNILSETYQDVAIPAGASSVYAQFWHKISTDETSTTTAWDSMAVQVRDPANGNVLQTLETFSNLHATSGWVQSRQYDLGSYRGRTIRLIFKVTTDYSNSTGFRVDDVAVMAAQGSQDRTLTVTIGGTGSGTVNSNPSGFTCSTGSCTGQFAGNSSVTLMATPSGTSSFAGWSGACSSSTGNCTVTMDSDKSVTATFSATSPVRLVGTPVQYYTGLQAAYNAAVDGDVIQSQAMQFVEDLVLNRAVRVKLSGGRDSSFGSATGATTLRGKLVVRSGSLVVERLVVK